jgi:hypothetical protein
VILVVLSGCSGDSGSDDLGFPVETPEDMGQGHLTQEEVEAIQAGTKSPPEYSSVPATSGLHASNWTQCGIYRQEVPEIFTVHTLEHGAVVVYYRPDLVGGAALEELEDLARSMATHIVVMPFAEMDTPVALVAWGHLARRPSLDLEEVRAFWGEFAQRGPEPGIPCPVEVDQAG